MTNVGCAPRRAEHASRRWRARLDRRRLRARLPAPARPRRRRRLHVPGRLHHLPRHADRLRPERAGRARSLARHGRRARRVSARQYACAWACGSSACPWSPSSTDRCARRPTSRHDAAIAGLDLLPGAAADRPGQDRHRPAVGGRATRPHRGGLGLATRAQDRPRRRRPVRRASAWSAWRRRSLRDQRRHGARAVAAGAARARLATSAARPTQRPIALAARVLAAVRQPAAAGPVLQNRRPAAACRWPAPPPPAPTPPPTRSPKARASSRRASPWRCSRACRAAATDLQLPTPIACALRILLQIGVSARRRASPCCPSRSSALVGGREYLPDSAIALSILICYLPLSYANGLTQYVLIAAGRQRLLTAAFVAALVFNVVANLMLIPRFSYVGAAWVTVAQRGRAAGAVPPGRRAGRARRLAPRAKRACPSWPRC